MYERWTDRARKVMALANQEAKRFNHGHIGTEHLLLGLAKEGSGVGANILKNSDVDLDKLRSEVEKLVKSGPEKVTKGKLPQTPRMKNVVEYAIEEARELNHHFVGTEHLLLGLIREEDGTAVKVLRNIGLNLEHVRWEILNLLGSDVAEPKAFRLGRKFEDVDELATAFMEFLENKKYYPAASLEEIAYFEATGDDDIMRVVVRDEGETLATIAFRINYNISKAVSMESHLDNNVDSDSVLAVKYGVFPGRPEEQGDFSIFEFGENDELGGMVESQFPTFDMLKFIHGLDFGKRSFCKKFLWLAKSEVALKVNVSRGGNYINLKAWGRTVAQLHRVDESSSKSGLGLALAGYVEEFPLSKSTNVFLTESAEHIFSGYKSGIQPEINWLNGKVGHPRLKHKAGLYTFDRSNGNDDEVIAEIIRLLGIAKENAKPDVGEPEPIEPDGGVFRIVSADMIGDTPRDANGQLIDQLGIEGDVNALSSVIAARKTPLPFAIGLFGDWGSGKSFFMEKMQERIEEIARQSKDFHKKEERDGYFCENIVQISFNAWHYMDANLWASLVTHIFDKLADHLTGGKKAKLEQKKKIIFENIESSKKLCEAAKRKKDKAADLRKATIIRLGELEGSEEKANKELKNISVKDAMSVVVGNENVKKQLKEIGLKLGLTNDKGDYRDICATVDQAGKLAIRIKLAIKRLLGAKPSKLKICILIVLIAVATVVLGTVASQFSSSDIIVNLSRIIGGILAFGASLANMIKPWLKQISGGMKLFEQTEQQIQEMCGKETLAIQTEKISLDQQIRKLDEEKSQVRKDLEDAEKSLEEATEELQEIETGRRLYNFILDRSGDSKYKDQLGIIAQIREDFEKLADLITGKNEDEELQQGGEDKGKSAEELRSIDRIILYIDDLDRCSSKRVVEVLQAVHLILGIKLFVVVVAVDSRWVLHALREEYAAFGGIDGENGDLSKRWLTTPQNYVEKIFQIPFALERMSDKGYKALVSGLVGDAEKDGDTKVGSDIEFRDREKNKANAVINEKESATKNSSKGEEGEKQSEIMLDGGGIDMEPLSLKLSGGEIEFMKEMDEFVSSPRATKRLVNIYKLICATLTDKESLEAFKGKDGPGEYRAVLLLLAMLTGYPSQAGDVLRALEKKSTRKRKLDTLIEELMGKADKKEKIDWERLSVSLNQTIKKQKIDIPLKQFEEWAGTVERFSFQYGRSNDHQVGDV